MSADPAAVRRMPIAGELFRQWNENRGAQPAGAAKVPFSRDWEKLLRDAGLESAEERREALVDADALDAAGLTRTKREKGRRYEILRVFIPLTIEVRWREIFADELAAAPERFDPGSVQWAPELAFVPASRLGVAAADLLRLDVFFTSGGAAGEPVPVKERSLELFGDEKRLDALRGTSLFAPGRLTLEQLRCFVVAEPLAWVRGPRVTGAILVVENLATFESFVRWNRATAEFSAIVYGGGNRFIDSVVRLPELFAELGLLQRVFYFGDLDAAGLRIPRRASEAAQREGLPPVEPDLRAYGWLLSRAHLLELSGPAEEPIHEEDLSWLGELRADAAALLARRARLPQELVGWAFLRAQS